MNGSTSSRCYPALFLSSLATGMLLVSCGSAVDMAEQATLDAPSNSLPESSSVAEKSLARAETDDNIPSSQTSQPPQAAPQLAKTAAISLEVKSIEETLKTISQLVKQQQGDILRLEDNSSRRREASMEIRVPQDRLETTLDALADLGTVESRSITAEDVSNQLVDVQARLRNLRKTEDSLLKIMDRAGSMSDTLKVAQELSNIRQSIEQIDAQLKNLTNRVAYSTITLNLQSSTATSSQPAIGSQLQDSWSNATQSVSDFTKGLLSLGIWLIAYSPYFLLIAGIVYLSYFRRHNQGNRQ
ncbi:MAG: DUF4349 domain-containing protein [Symploca sp. SIO2E6]|nr:DUF4349 domain-containing protein [Symploca sp. SIO2E6]